MIVAGLAEEQVESSRFEKVAEDVVVVLGISSLAIVPTKQKNNKITCKSIFKIC